MSPATIGPIKLPPQHNTAPDHPPDHNYSNPFSSLHRLSQRRSLSPAVADSNDGSRSGAFVTPPGSPSDRNLSQRVSLLYPNPRAPFDIPSSGSSGIGSHRERGERASTGGAVSAAASASQAVSVPRSLPHSPPPESRQPSSGQNHSSVPSPSSSVFPDNEKRRSHRKSDEISRASQSQPSNGEYPLRSTAPSTGDNLGAEGLQSPFQDPNIAAASNAHARPLRDSMMSSSTAEHGNAPPSSWRSALSPFLPRPPSVVSDPFNNRDFEVPIWLDSDPYSRLGEGARATTSTYSAAQRSVAASSKMLPSEASVRTLTPEPSEDNHNATLHVAVLARFRTTSLGQGTDAEGAIPGESVEGDGPESYALRITDGAQRRGWGTENKKQPPRDEVRGLASSSRPRLLHIQHRSSEIAHPASSSPTSPSSAVPLSTEFDARGLGRSFIQSLINKVSWSPSTSRDNSRLLTPSQEATRGPEGLPTWLHGDPFEMPRASIGAASSKLLPSEVGHGDSSSKLLPSEVGQGDASSIHSASAEVGWIEPHPEPADMQSPLRTISETVNESGAMDVPQGVINQKPESSVAPGAQEPSQSQSQPRASPPISVPPPS